MAEHGPEWVSPKQVARAFGVTTRTLQNWVRAGTFPPPVRLSGATVRWRQRDIDSFLDRRAVPA